MATFEAMAPIEVLIVEDDASIREGLSDLLSQSGCITAEAPSGRVALELLRGRLRKPTVILLDMVMPDMDGWQFRAEQLGDPSLAMIPVIIMSASRDALDIPGQAHIPKPFSSEQLLRTVQRVARMALG